jgi:hypothetical protein
MTTGYEPVLHALSVEPRMARPGEIVSIAFRARNDGALPSPAGTVAFELPAGLEPLDDVEAMLPSVDAGDTACATLRARVSPPRDHRTALTLRARLTLPDLHAATNTCTVRVRSQALLDGSESGTFVELLDADTLHVRAVVRNEGDGPALEVCVHLPVPPGCRRLDGEETLVAERIDPGEALVVEYAVRIEQALERVAADGAGVRFGSKPWQPLAVRRAVVLEPRLAAPAVEARSVRRRIELDVALRNDGWAHALDVPLRIALPTGLQLSAPSFAVDGISLATPRRRRGAGPAVARLQQQGDAHLLMIALIPARSSVRVTFTATHDGNVETGLLELCSDDHRVEAELLPERHDELRVEPLVVPACVPPAGVATIRARIVNAGDLAERCEIALERGGLTEATPLGRALDPGAFAIVELALSVPATATDGSRIPFALVLSDDHGERLRHELNVVVRAPSGYATPHDDAAIDEDADSVAPVVHAVLRAPDSVTCGAPFAVSLDIDVEDAVESLTVRTVEDEATPYVLGSTTVGDCVVLDCGGRSRLFGGLALRGIPSATRVTIGWTLLAAAPPGTSLAIGAELDVDGTRRAVAPIGLDVHDTHAFALRPAELRYHVDAPTVPSRAQERVVFDNACVDDNQGAAATPALVPRPSVGASLSVPVRRWNDVARLMHGARCNGLVLHVLALRALYPEADDDATETATIARDVLGEALRDLFDRLFVKLRIPNFVTGTDDLEDRALRRALLAFVDAGGDIARHTALLDAPLGGPTALRALIAAMPGGDDAPIDRAVEAYLSGLDAALTAFEDLPLEVFAAALARGRDRTLDEARADVLAQLDEQLAVEPLAC